LTQRGQHRRTVTGEVRPVRPGSENTAEVHEGSLGTWETLRLHLDSSWREGTAKPEGPWPQAGVGPERSADRRTGWYGQAKQ
jgi:hypothetical protein